MSHVKSLYVEIKRDELEALRARMAELETYYNEACDDAMGVARELAALKAQQPSAGVADERSAFESWYRGNWGWPDSYAFATDKKGQYEAIHPREQWAVWQARALLNARLNPCRAQAVPDGYVIVPVEPTESMYAKCRLHTLVAAQVWKGMLAAAPSANHCQHRFMHFGDQANRRCAVCCAVEQFANHTEQNIDMVPGERKKEFGK